jgi:hypothetical protein
MVIIIAHPKMSLQPLFPPGPRHVPNTITLDTFDINQALISGSTVPCSHCNKSCQKDTMYSLRNSNPTHKAGASVAYVIPFCTSICRKSYISKCIDTAPFQVGIDIVFCFSVGSGGPDDGYWTMFSTIPEDGRWVICQCTDEGVLLLDERERPIWMLIDDALLRQEAVRVYN